MKRVVLLIGCCSLSACVWNPPNRTNAESTSTITLTGLAPTGGTVTLTARNLNTNVIETIGTAVASASPEVTTPLSLSTWSATLAPAARFWAPQSVVVNGAERQLNGLATSGGRVEITASSGGWQFATFSAAAQRCVAQQQSSGLNSVQAGAACYDGQSLVVFDNSGVGSNAATDPWVSDFSTVDQNSGIPWEIGHYTVEGKTIYGMVCRPSAPGRRKAVIINHGGFELNEIALKGFCIPGAQAGWVVAMSAYRGEKIKRSPRPGRPDDAPDQPIVAGARVFRSDGNIELCLGEVTDVMRLTEIVSGWPSVDPDQMLMWGHSHGGCITVRALQRGVKVKAAAAFAAPTDMAAWYKYSPPSTPSDTVFTNNRVALSTMFGDGTTLVTPDQSRIPYDWRSPVTYAEDLKARTDVKILLLQGTTDPLIHPSQACALTSAYAPSNLPAGTASMNWHRSAPGPGGVVTIAATPANCFGYTGLTWQSGPLPSGSWPNSRYLLVYENLDHGSIIPGAWADFLNWVNATFP